MIAPDTVGIPGAELVLQGLHDLHQGHESTGALLVAIGATRLRALGFDIPRVYDSREHRLYEHLAKREG